MQTDDKAAQIARGRWSNTSPVEAERRRWLRWRNALTYTTLRVRAALEATEKNDG